MTQTAVTPIRRAGVSEISAKVAAEIRAEMGRKEVTKRGLARALGELPTWVTNRISPGSARGVEISLEDLDRIAGVLGVSVRQLLPRLDSNQQPFD